MNLHKNARTCPYSRALIIERMVMRGEPARVVGEDLGISERTVRKWIARYRAASWDGLVDRSSRAHRLAHQLNCSSYQFFERILGPIDARMRCFLRKIATLSRNNQKNINGVIALRMDIATIEFLVAAQMRKFVARFLLVSRLKKNSTEGS